MIDLDFYQERDAHVLAWARRVTNSLKLAAPKSKRSYKKRASKEKSLSATISNLNSRKDGTLYAVGFKFKRAGVFAEMGVFGGLTRAEAQARGKLKPMPWFNPVMRQQITGLLDILEDNTADRVNSVLGRLEIKNI